jgi:sugar phosphate isomerase/epimerase
MTDYSRRKFMQATGLAALFAATPMSLSLARPSMARSRPAFSLQTYSLKELNRHHLVPVLESLDIRGVELYDRHLSPTTSLDDFTAGVREFEKAGISLSGLYTERFNGDLSHDERILRLAYLAGIPDILTSLPEDRLATVSGLAEKWDINLLVHNQSPGPDATLVTPDDLYAHLGRFPRVDLCLDIGNLVRAGHDPAETISAMGPRVRVLHVKDVDADGRHTNLGDGTIDLDAVFRARERHASSAHVVLEYGGQPDDVQARIDALAVNVQRLGDWLG